MISEKNIASVFSGFWNQCLPLLTPSFIRVFNEAYLVDLTELPSSKFKKIEIGDAVEKHDLVAEFSFCLAEAAHLNSVSVIELKKDQNDWIKVYQNAIGFLKRYASEAEQVVLNQTEIDEAFELASQYQSFFDVNQSTNILFRPQLRGAGFMGQCAADLSMGDTLYEVKTVSRNLGSMDIKQLLIYLALQSSNPESKWKYAGFFNPRRALSYRFSIDLLIYRTSGGRSTLEVFEDILDFLSERAIEIDSVF